MLEFETVYFDCTRPAENADSSHFAEQTAGLLESNGLSFEHLQPTRLQWQWFWQNRRVRHDHLLFLFSGFYYLEGGRLFFSAADRVEDPSFGALGADELLAAALQAGYREVLCVLFHDLPPEHDEEGTGSFNLDLSVLDTGFGLTAARRKKLQAAFMWPDRPEEGNRFLRLKKMSLWQNAFSASLEDVLAGRLNTAGKSRTAGGTQANKVALADWAELATAKAAATIRSALNVNYKVTVFTRGDELEWPLPPPLNAGGGFLDGLPFEIVEYALCRRERRPLKSLNFQFDQIPAEYSDFNNRFIRKRLSSYIEKQARAFYRELQNETGDNIEMNEEPEGFGYQSDDYYLRLTINQDTDRPGSITESRGIYFNHNLPARLKLDRLLQPNRLEVSCRNLPDFSEIRQKLEEADGARVTVLEPGHRLEARFDRSTARFEVARDDSAEGCISISDSLAGWQGLARHIETICSYLQN